MATNSFDERPVSRLSLIERFFLFSEHALVLFVMSVMLGVATLFIDGRYFAFGSVVLAFGLHRSKAMAGIEGAGPRAVYVILMLLSSLGSWMLGVRLNASRLPHRVEQTSNGPHAAPVKPQVSERNDGASRLPVTQERKAKPQKRSDTPTDTRTALIAEARELADDINSLNTRLNRRIEKAWNTARNEKEEALLHPELHPHFNYDSFAHMEERAAMDEARAEFQRNYSRRAIDVREKILEETPEAADAEPNGFAMEEGTLNFTTGLAIELPNDIKDLRGLADACERHLNRARAKPPQ